MSQNLQEHITLRDELLETAASTITFFMHAWLSSLSSQVFYHYIKPLFIHVPILITCTKSLINKITSKYENILFFVCVCIMIVLYITLSNIINKIQTILSLETKDFKYVVIYIASHKNQFLYRKTIHSEPQNRFSKTNLVSFIFFPWHIKW
jgi:hypothetical protein